MEFNGKRFFTECEGEVSAVTFRILKGARADPTYTPAAEDHLRPNRNSRRHDERCQELV